MHTCLLGRIYCPKSVKSKSSLLTFTKFINFFPLMYYEQLPFVVYRSSQLQFTEADNLQYKCPSQNSQLHAPVRAIFAKGPHYTKILLANTAGMRCGVVNKILLSIDNSHLKISYFFMYSLSVLFQNQIRLGYYAICLLYNLLSQCNQK